MKKSLNEIRCFEMPGKWVPGVDLELYNKTYQFWKSVYETVYSESNHPQSLSPDNFVIQDKIVSLASGEEVIGCILFSFHGTKAKVSTEIKYFSELPFKFTSLVPEFSQKNFMLMESLTVHPEWRKSKSGLPLADYLLGFAMRCFVESGADVLVGTPRNDVKVDKILNRFGGKRHGDFEKSNYPCSFYLFNAEETIVAPPGMDNLTIKRLWENRRLAKEGVAA